MATYRCMRIRVKFNDYYIFVRNFRCKDNRIQLLLYLELMFSGSDLWISLMMFSFRILIGSVGLVGRPSLMTH